MKNLNTSERDTCGLTFRVIHVRSTEAHSREEFRCGYFSTELGGLRSSSVGEGGPLAPITSIARQ